MRNIQTFFFTFLDKLSFIYGLSFIMNKDDTFQSDDCHKSTLYVPDRSTLMEVAFANVPSLLDPWR